MAITLVQSRTAEANNYDSITLAYNSNVTSGNLLTVCGGVWNGNEIATFTHTDTRSTGYSAILGSVTPAGFTLKPWIAYGMATSSGANTVTLDPQGGGRYSSHTIAEWSGIAAMTALKVDGSAVTQPVSAASLPLPTGASTAAKQPALGTAGTASADVLTVQGIASMTALKVDGSAVTQPVSGTFWQATQPVSLASVPSHAVTNAGTFATQAAQSGTWTVQPGNTANTTPWLVAPVGLATDGLSIFRSLDLDETEEDVKTSAGVVYGCWVTNTATSTRWLKFYNATAANVTVGTTTPVITIGIPGNSSDDISGNFGPGGVGIGFSTAICVAATTGVADADTGAPAANDLIINVFYK